MNYEHAMSILTAIVTGKEVELRRSRHDDWRKFDIELDRNELLRERVIGLNNPSYWRIKPVLRKVPLAASDIKPGMVFNSCPVLPGRGYAIPSRVGVNGLLFTTAPNQFEIVEWERLSRFWLWSLDGETWHPCEKEVAE